MDFDEAIRAHTAWKTKLLTYLNHPDKSLRGMDVCFDNNCTLGKWLHQAPRQVSSLPEFTVLRHAHARFHRAAGAVIDQANGARPPAASEVLGPESEFGQASRETVSAVMKIKRKVAEVSLAGAKP